MMPASQEDGMELKVVSLLGYVKEEPLTLQQGQPFDPIPYLNVISSNSGTSTGNLKTHLLVQIQSFSDFVLALLMYYVSQSRPGSQNKFNELSSAVD